MNRFIIIALCAILNTYGTCQNTTTEKTTTQENISVAQPKVEKQKGPKLSREERGIKVVPNPDAPKRPENLNADATKKTRKNYFVSTARQRSKIDTLFPYDLTFKDLNGKELKSVEAMPKNGKPTVLLFWLTTCPPCRIEMANMKKKYEGWKEQADFNLYAISTDFPKNHERFFKTVKEQEWGWDSYLDINREFLNIMPGRLNGLPQTFILDKNGKIVYHKRKYLSGDEDKMFEKVLEMVNKG